MKPIRFLLKSVLQLYAMQEENARADLNRAVHTREFVTDVLAAARQDWEAHLQTYCEQRRCTFAARSHVEHWAILQESQASCAVVEQRLALAVETETRARGVLFEARRRHKMMLELHSRHIEKQRRAELRHEELALADSYQASRVDGRR